MANKSKNKVETKKSLKDKIVDLFAGVSRETKRIRWPKLSELMSNTGKVLFFCVLFAIFFVLCDLVVSGILVKIGVGQ